jgi:Homeodomain
MPRRMRVRPTAEQTDELKKLYHINPHPTTDQRQLLAERIGM